MRKLFCKLNIHRPSRKTHLQSDEWGRNTALCAGCGVHLTRLSMYDYDY